MVDFHGVTIWDDSSTLVAAPGASGCCNNGNGACQLGSGLPKDNHRHAYPSQLFGPRLGHGRLHGHLIPFEPKRHASTIRGDAQIFANKREDVLPALRGQVRRLLPY